ncbi:hypothetical protein K501DRAFT_336761, partial [Backusella circina FSU 941]
MTVVINEKENDRKKTSYFSHKQVVATAATVASARDPKTYSTMAHFRKKWISFKNEFHSDVDKPPNSHKMNWKIWKRRTSKTSPIPQQQALFNFNLPIVISSTHNYYDNKQTEEGRRHYYLQSKDELQKAPSHSIMQQLTIIPSFNANLFLIVVLVALLVIAFGILQIHRTISILNTGIDLIRHTLTISVSITRTLISSVMSLFFK